MNKITVKPGLFYYPAYLSDQQCHEILYQVRDLDFFKPKMPKSGKEFSVKMSNFGDLGWVSDEKGYRYEKSHPINSEPWPKIPQNILQIWREFVKNEKPDCCLVNYYDKSAKMGLHVDNDEQDLLSPVISISLGASASFRVGGLKRGDKTSAFRLNHGDIVVLSSHSRLCYHGIDRIFIDGSFNYRVNLTLRKVL